MIQHSLIKTIMIETTSSFQGTGSKGKTSEYMKFPCDLMCLSFRAAIPLRAVATVQIH